MLITDLSPFCRLGLQLRSLHSGQPWASISVSGRDSSPWSQAVKSLIDVTVSKSLDGRDSRQTLLQHRSIGPWFDFCKDNEYISWEAIKSLEGPSSHLEVAFQLLFTWSPPPSPRRPYHKAQVDSLEPHYFRDKSYLATTPIWYRAWPRFFFWRLPNFSHPLLSSPDRR